MSDNVLLGYITCPKGSRAEVRQTIKKGRHFYTNCGKECCGLVQGTGAVIQQDIYDNAEFLPGVTIVKPANVVEKSEPVGEPKRIEAAPESEPEAKPKREPQSDFDPVESEVEAVPSEPRGLVRFVPGIVLLVAAGVGVWMG